MDSAEFRSLALVAIVALLGTAPQCRVQEISIPTPAGSPAVLVNLSRPIYPKIARAAHVSGDMVLTVKVRKDGSVVSATVDSGPALLVLRAATLDSVTQSHFYCRGCGDSPETVQMQYSFKLDDPAEPCKATRSDAPGADGPQPYPRISHLGNHVTVVDLPVVICDPAATVRKVRSVKCLYLWSCAVKS
jgi:hypothetical protein